MSIRQRLGVQIRTGVIGIHWFSDPRRERQRVECLAVASEKELTARFEEALRQAYAPIFQVAEPTDGYIQVRDAFRTNTPHSQQKRMVTLFLNLCEAAGMITEIPKASSPGPAPVRTKPKSGAAASSALKSRAETMLPPASRPDHAPLRPNLRAVDPQCHHRRESLMAAEPAPVPPLSAYLAKQCPRRVQLDLVEPGVSLEPTADIQMPLDEGVAFEASVVTELRAVAGSDWVFVDQTASPGLQIDDTTSATLSYSAPRCSRMRSSTRLPSTRLLSLHHRNPLIDPPVTVLCDVVGGEAGWVLGDGGVFDELDWQFRASALVRPVALVQLRTGSAKQCPRRVQLDLVEPGVSLEPTADIQMPLDEGVAFEASVVTELRAVAGSDWVFVDQTASPGLQIDDTTSATLSYSAPRCSRMRSSTRLPSTRLLSLHHRNPLIDPPVTVLCDVVGGEAGWVLGDGGVFDELDWQFRVLICGEYKPGEWNELLKLEREHVVDQLTGGVGVGGAVEDTCVLHLSITPGFDHTGRCDVGWLSCEDDLGWRRRCVRHHHRTLAAVADEVAVVGRVPVGGHIDSTGLHVGPPVEP